MRPLRRNKRKIYLCQKYQDGELTKFKEPIEMYENYVPTTSDGDLAAIGMDYPKYLRIKTSAEEKKLFHPEDRVYVYVDKPAKHDVLCRDADYEVYKDPSKWINEMDVMLYRISGNEDE